MKEKPDNKQQRSVVVIGAGGTIAATSATRADFQNYRGGARGTTELVDSLRPEIDGIARAEPVDFPGEDGGCRTLRDYHAMSLLVDARLADADAVVVLSGTKSLEELAYWLDLTVRSDKPVVVTGSIRPWNAFGSDGPANLYNAVALAATGRTTGFGTVVLFNDRILTARDATKSNTLRVDGYRGHDWGVLGVVDGTNIRLLRAPGRVRRHGTEGWSTPFDLAGIDPATLPRTEIAYSYADASGVAITAFARDGVAGIVMAGDPSERQGAAIKEAIGGGTVFVAANRNTAGSVYETGVPGIVSAEDLLPQKARVLLTLGLALTGDVARLRCWFQRYGVPEFG